jgi:hypothetical protein
MGQYKYKKPVLRLWKRLLTAFDFKDQVLIFRKEHNIPEKGFSNLKELRAWQDSIDDPIALVHSFGMKLLKKYDLLKYNETEHLLRGIQEYVLMKKFSIKKMFKINTHGCQVHSGWAFMKHIQNDSFSDDAKHQLMDSLVIIVPRHTTQTSLKQLGADKDLWGRIKDQRKRYASAKIPVPRKFKTDDYRLITKAFKKNVIDSRGFLTKDYKIIYGEPIKIPQEFLEVLKDKKKSEKNGRYTVKSANTLKKIIYKQK